MGRKIISQAAWIMLLVVIVSKRGKATLDIKPTDTVVLRSDSTFFNCSTFNFSSSSEEIAWYHYSVGSDQRNDVYEDGEIRTNYESRFRVEKDLSKGVVNLIVQSPTLEDAGTYECQDEQGIGETARGQLTVLETKPVCQSNIQPDGVIGSNDCGIPPDQVEMSCSITYLGNSPVHLEWRNGLENDNSSLTVECSNTTNRSTCNLTIRGDHAGSNSAYICQTKSTGTNAYSCSPYVIRILYVLSDNTTISKTDHDEVKCEANSSQQCSYTWSSDDGTVVSTSESLKPTRSGQYVCRANCNIRDEICIVTAKHLNVSIETTIGETNKAGLITGVIVLLVIAAIISTIAIVVWHQYKKGKKRKTQHRDGNDDNVGLPLHNTINAIECQDPTDTPVSVHSRDAVLSEVSIECIIQKAFNAKAYIGKGLSGDIYSPVQYDDKQCACEKIMFPPDQRTPANKGEMTKGEKICRKGQEWMALDHDNLIKFYDVVLQPPAVYIIMEYAPGGYVRKALDNCTKELPIELVRDWATQVAECMSYLHNKGIVHKGLKCAQILIMEPFVPSTPEQVTLKVGNYNLTYEVNNTNPATFKGMFAWMAPEAILESKHSNNSDIWSYGVTVWEILTREIPYKDILNGEIIKGIPSGELSLKIPESCPEGFHNIIKECFDMEPTKRPAFTEILTRLRDID